MRIVALVLIATAIASMFTACAIESGPGQSPERKAATQAALDELLESPDSGSGAAPSPTPQSSGLTGNSAARSTGDSSVEESIAPVAAPEDSGDVMLRFKNDMPDSMEVRIIGTSPAPETEHGAIDFGTLAPGETTEYKAPPGLLDEGDTWAFLVYVDGEIRPKDTGCSNCEWFSVGEPYKRWTITFYTPDPTREYSLYPPGAIVAADFD